MLPRNGLWYSVQTEKPVTRRWLIARLFCKHTSRTTHLYVDSRGGPGWMSDTYEGITCCSCGAMIQNRRIY